MEPGDEETVLTQLDQQIAVRRHASDEARAKTTERGEEEQARFQGLVSDLDLTPDTLRETLRVAIGVGTSREVLEGPDGRGRMRLSGQLPHQWQAVVDDCLRLPAPKGIVGAMPWLVFDQQFFIQNINGRPVFRSSPDTVLMHLGHPLLRHALASFARLRFPGSQADRLPPSRWTVTRGDVPPGSDALLLLTVEEMAVNELRETFHHWVRTLAMPVQKGQLRAALPYKDPNYGQLRDYAGDKLTEARSIWDEVEGDLRDFLKEYRSRITASVKTHLAEAGKESRSLEKEAFERRINEVAALQRNQSIEKLRREIDDRRNAARQFDLLEDADERAEREIRDLEDELKRRTTHFGDLLQRLKDEKERILERVIPSRFALRGEAQVFPVTIEIRFPQVRQ